LENDKTFDHGSIIDVNKLMLRIDELEIENISLSNKLEKLAEEHTKLMEYMKNMKNPANNIISKPNLNKVLFKLKDKYNLSMVRIGLRRNHFNTTCALVITNVRNLLKELNNISLIEENLPYLKDKIFTIMLKKYKFIQHFMDLLLPNEMVGNCDHNLDFRNQHHIVYNMNTGKTYDNTSMNENIFKHCKLSHVNQLKNYVHDLKDFSVTNTEYCLHSFGGNGYAKGDINGESYFRFKHFQQEIKGEIKEAIKEEIKQFRENIIYCQVNSVELIECIDYVLCIKTKLNELV